MYRPALVALSFYILNLVITSCYDAIDEWR